MRRTFRSRAHDQRGAALVEFALVIIPLLMLILGAVTGGLAYNRKITLTDAARVAARYATTHAIPGGWSPLETPPCTTTPASSPLGEWLVDVACYAIPNAQGELDEGTSGRMICVAYIPPSGLSSMLEWGTSNTGSITTGHSCPGATPPASISDTIVEVVVERTANLDAVVWNHTLTLTSAAFGRCENCSV